jgi:NAD-dependent SIR2 family protein deacetylase
MPKSNTTLNDMPICECPYCEKTFHWDDYHNVEAGDTYECPCCTSIIYVRFVEYTITATLGTEGEDDG